MRAIDADAAIAYLYNHKRVARDNGIILAADEDAIIKFLDEKCPTLTPPNEALTLEELSLCNDPVWIKRIGDVDICDDGWAIVEGPTCLTRHDGVPVSWEIRVWWPGSEVEDYPKYEKYGKTWFAYRRPPEGKEDT